MSVKATTFFSLVSVEERIRFLAGDRLVDTGPRPNATRPDPAFELFLELDPDHVAASAIRQYVHEVLPKPRLLFEHQLWAISCMPQTNGRERTFTLSCPGIEALFGYRDDAGNHVFRMGLLREELPVHLLPDIAHRHELDETAFEDAGYASIAAVLLTFPAERMSELLTDPHIVRAARSFVVTRFSVGGNSYGKWQSLPLVAHVLG